jgi:signal transduction histidine kinase
VPEIPEINRARDLARQILETYRRRLVAEDYALVRDPTNLDEVLRQVELILDDVLLPGVVPTGASQLFALEVGANRARAGVHPTESLRAAALLFEVALPIILSRYAGADANRALAISLALHGAVMDRVVLASLSYVEYLQDRLHALRREERTRISRELHDRIGHGMGVALQHLDLYRHYLVADPPRADGKLTSAIESLTGSIQTVQEISAELRRSVGGAGTETALRAYLSANVPPDVSATLHVTGDAKSLPPTMGEELYLILREAIRNAVRHAHPSKLRVTIAVDDTAVHATIADDGRGFEPDVSMARLSGGLSSMSERTELLRGQISFESKRGAGTTVRVVVPIEGSSR